MKRKNSIVIPCLMLAVACLAGCGQRYVPRPRGYFRIDLPQPTYKPYAPPASPYAFELSDQTQVRPRTGADEQFWIDILYPHLNAAVHCSYKPVQSNLRALSADAQNFVYKHATIASAIPEQGFDNPEQHVYGLLYELQGNTASPCQFYLTDSTHHFFRGAVYFNNAPNQDSLAPVINYIRNDVRHLMETFRWQE